MATYRIEIDCENEAFDGGWGQLGTTYEIRRILTDLVERLDPGIANAVTDSFTLRDKNGNTVGEARMHGAPTYVRPYPDNK